MEVRVRLRIKEILEERKMTQGELSLSAGVRPAAISSMARGNVERVALAHIEKIAAALDIDDANEIFSFERTE